MRVINVTVPDGAVRRYSPRSLVRAPTGTPTMPTVASAIGWPPSRIVTRPVIWCCAPATDPTSTVATNAATMLVDLRTILITNPPRREREEWVLEAHTTGARVWFARGHGRNTGEPAGSAALCGTTLRDRGRTTVRPGLTGPCARQSTTRTLAVNSLGVPFGHIGWRRSPNREAQRRQLTRFAGPAGSRRPH